VCSKIERKESTFRWQLSIRYIDPEKRFPGFILPERLSFVFAKGHGSGLHHSFPKGVKQLF
jgi:hypothetical protein